MSFAITTAIKKATPAIGGHENILRVAPLRFDEFLILYRADRFDTGIQFEIVTVSPQGSLSVIAAEDLVVDAEAQFEKIIRNARDVRQRKERRKRRIISGE